MRTQRPLPLLGGLALALAALACTCGPITRITGAAATANAVRATLEAEATSLGPRVQAELTRLAEDVTRRGPEVWDTATAAAATADALGLAPGAAQTQAARQAAIAETARALYDEQHQPPPGTPPPPVGDDAAPFVDHIAVGQTRTAAIGSAGEEHRWLFDALAGQAVTVEVSTPAGVPGVTIFAPEGHVLYETAGSTEPVARIVATLPTDGQYTVGVSLSAPGEYTITLSE